MENYGVTKREIATSIILSIVTGGLYSIYWFITLTDDVGKLSKDDHLRGGMCFLLTLVTCGLYGFYWAYLMGKAMYKIKTEKNIAGTSDNSVIYIILQLFGLQIVTLALVQNDVNTLLEG